MTLAELLTLLGDHLPVISAIGTGIAAVVGAGWTFYVYRQNRKKEDAEKAPAPSGAAPPQGKASKFWSALSKDVVVVYGAGYSAEDPEKGWARHSRRDLRAALAVHDYLLHHGKNVSLHPATDRGWQTQLTSGKDLVVIGGFVSNVEFARQQSLFRSRDNVRLKMGRLCRTDGQQVYHVAFGELPGKLAVRSRDARDAPARIDRIPSNYVTRDFAYVYSARAEVYGATRRVVAIGGIKGNGTVGGAHCLTRADSEPDPLDAMLTGPLSGNDTLELIVAVECFDDQINKAEIVEAFLNSDRIFIHPKLMLSRACRLGIACRDCTFGEEAVDRHGETTRANARPERGEVAAIVFDLDDTLIDTFSQLIVPLEERAARRMIESGYPDLDVGRVASRMLEARRASPDKIEELVSREAAAHSAACLAARRAVLSDVPLDGLSIDPRVPDLLRELGKSYKLYLMSEGSWAFQNAKIDAVALRPLFEEIVIVQTDLEEVKERKLAELLGRRNLSPSSVVIVGNRLDKEILAGSKLGMTTIWVRHGEGSEVPLGPETGVPSYVVESILLVGDILKPNPVD